MFKKILVLLAGLLVTVAVYAASSELRPDHPDTYVVKKGDTLWDISAHFLRKPWLWPEIWQANPQVHNPHLIYPGDVLDLSYLNAPILKLEPKVRSENLPPVAAIPLSDLKMFLRDMRVVGADRLKNAPYVVGFEENSMRGVSGQFLYVRGLAAQPGKRYAVVRPSHMFRDYGSNAIVAHALDSAVSMVPSPWDEDFRNDGHYGSGDILGVEARVIGTAEVLRGGDPSTLLLTDQTREIRKGDRLLPVNDNPYDSSYYPHAPKAMPPHGHVIELADAMYVAGKRQVVALSVGAAQGVDNGTTFSVFQPGARIADDVASDPCCRAVGKHVKLPSEYVGHVMVFRTFNHVSYGLIMDDIRPIRPGDELRTPQ